MAVTYFEDAVGGDVQKVPGESSKVAADQTQNF